MELPGAIVDPFAESENPARTSGRARPSCTGMLAPPDMVEHTQRVVGAVMHLDIAVDRSAGDELERRMKSGEHDRHRVVGPGVDIEDELLRASSCHER